jgi:tetratricopeptide (TPR) repeat protein
LQCIINYITIAKKRYLIDCNKYEIALFYYNLQELEKAMEYIKKSLILDPNFEESKNLKSLIGEI